MIAIIKLPFQAVLIMIGAIVMVAWAIVRVLILCAIGVGVVALLLNLLEWMLTGRPGFAHASQQLMLGGLILIMAWLVARYIIAMFSVPYHDLRQSGAHGPVHHVPPFSDGWSAPSPHYAPVLRLPADHRVQRLLRRIRTIRLF